MVRQGPQQLREISRIGDRGKVLDRWLLECAPQVTTRVCREHAFGHAETEHTGRVLQHPVRRLERSSVLNAPAHLQQLRRLQFGDGRLADAGKDKSLQAAQHPRTIGIHPLGRPGRVPAASHVLEAILGGFARQGPSFGLSPVTQGGLVQPALHGRIMAFGECLPHLARERPRLLQPHRRIDSQAQSVTLGAVDEVEAPCMPLSWDLGGFQGKTASVAQPLQGLGLPSRNRSFTRDFVDRHRRCLPCRLAALGSWAPQLPLLTTHDLS